MSQPDSDSGTRDRKLNPAYSTQLGAPPWALTSDAPTVEQPPTIGPPHRSAYAAPGTADRLYSAKRPPGALTALVVSVLALITAIVSMVFSSRAMDRADRPHAIDVAGPDATANAGQTPTEPAQTATSVPTVPPPTTRPPTDGPDASGQPPLLDEHTVFSEKYSKQPLLFAASCGLPTYADLDEPRVGVPDVDSDLQFYRTCSPVNLSVFRLGSQVDGSVGGSTAITPQECLNRIRTAPIGNVNIPVRPGIVMCLATSYAAAVVHGHSQLIVRIIISDVAENGSVTIEATAWGAH